MCAASFPPVDPPSVETPWRDRCWSPTENALREVEIAVWHQLGRAAIDVALSRLIPLQAADTSTPCWEVGKHETGNQARFRQTQTSRMQRLEGLLKSRQIAWGSSG